VRRSHAPAQWSARGVILAGTVLLVVLLVLGVLSSAPGHVARTSGAGGLQFSAHPPPPPPPLVVSIINNTSAIDLGQSITLFANASGGSGVPTNWQYTWNNLPTGCVSASVANYTCTPTANGTWNVSVSVHDSHSHQTTISANATVIVNPELSIVEVTNSVGTNVTSGYNFTISVLVSGGTPPIAYSYVGLPTGCTGTTSSSVTCVAGPAGNYTYGIQVADATGATNSTSINLTVTMASKSTPPPPTKTVTSIGATTYEEIAGVLIVGAIIVVALLVKARRDERQTFLATPRIAPASGVAAAPPPSTPGAAAPSASKTEEGTTPEPPKPGGGSG
jgi:hypothetical protein